MAKCFQIIKKKKKKNLLKKMLIFNIIDLLTTLAVEERYTKWLKSMFTVNIVF